MSMKYLGEQFDIHTGGEDNIFPHHESEIAQSEGATGKRPWVKCWMHTRFLLVNGQKMSKSLGNFFTLRDLVEKGCDPMAVRYVLMSTHYRQPLNFTLESVEAAKEAIRRLKDFRTRLKEANAPTDNPELVRALEQGRRRFDEALADDLNTSAALAALFDMVRDVKQARDKPRRRPKGSRPPLALRQGDGRSRRGKGRNSRRRNPGADSGARRGAQEARLQDLRPNP